MKQPELGRKIAELRKAKGFTQEELVEMCNLSVRTLQRIELGEVLPRSHTIRVIFAAAALVLLGVCIDGNAQSEKKVKKIIEANSENLMQWFNAGDLDALMSLYSDDACLVGQGCGKAVFREYYGTQMRFFKFDELKAISISVADSIAVERGRWSGTLDSGVRLSGEYLTEWRRRDKTWLIVNDIASNE